jgi:hypothetical protein
MAVVTAEMCFSGDLRPTRDPLDLLDRQPVQFRPKHDRRARHASLVNSKDTMPAQSCDDLVRPCRRKDRLHFLRGLLFLSRQLGLAVQVPPSRN